MLKEEHLIDLVDCVGQVDGGLDHVGEADPGDLHDVLHVGEGKHGLLLHPPRQLSSAGVQPDLAGEVEHPVQADRLGGGSIFGNQANTDWTFKSA